jgi:hypothetical protein
MNQYCVPFLLLGIAVFPAQGQELSAQEIFKKVSPSVVKVEATETKGNALATGSGVVFAHGKDGFFKVATNCHVVDVPGSDQFPYVYHGKNYGVGSVIARDADRDVCLLFVRLPQRDAAGETVRSNNAVVSLPAPPVAQIAPLRTLEVGERVYAIGAPQGLDLTLSNGLVSGFRDYKGTEYIQTSAPISKGSSGGGLFDAQGRLVGITTMFLKDGQNLNFAIPAELIASVPVIKKENVQLAAQVPEPRPAPPRDRWVYIGSAVNDQYDIYVDTKTITRNGNNVTAWERWEYPKPVTTKGDTYDEQIRRNIYHCDSRQWTLLSVTDKLKGSVVWSGERKSYQQERKSIQPDTVGEAIYEWVCGQ